MRQSEEFFGDRELRLLHIARRLSEAKRLEQALTDAAIDYLVEVDQYVGGVIFRSARAGAFFYVVDSERSRAADLLAERGFKVFTQEPSD